MFVVLLLSLFAVGHAVELPAQDRDLSLFLEAFLPRVVRRQNLDPADIPNFSIEILSKEEKTPKGKAYFYNGRLTGLSKATKVAEAAIECLRPAIYRMRCFLGFDNLKLAYDGKIKYDSKPMIPFQVHVDIPFQVVFVEVMNYPRTDKPFTLPGKPALKKIVLHRIDETGKLKPKFYSTSPLKGLTKILENGIISHTKTVVFSFLSNKLKHVLRKTMTEVSKMMPTFGACVRVLPKKV